MNTEDKIQELNAHVTGRVQGVFFRANTKSNAHELGLTGWVSNEPDGSVHVCAQGPESRLRALLEFLYVGTSSSEVEKVDVSWDEPTEHYTGFDIRG